MRQELAVETGRGRATAGRAETGRDGQGRAAPIKTEIYLDRHAPSVFQIWWSGLVSMNSALGRDGLK